MAQLIMNNDFERIQRFGGIETTITRSPTVVTIVAKSVKRGSHMALCEINCFTIQNTVLLVNISKSNKRIMLNKVHIGWHFSQKDKHTRTVIKHANFTRALYCVFWFTCT